MEILWHDQLRSLISGILWHDPLKKAILWNYCGIISREGRCMVILMYEQQTRTIYGNTEL